MSKKPNARARRRQREQVRAALEPLPPKYVLDEVLRTHYGLTGDGKVTFFVRDGFVTAADVLALPATRGAERAKLAVEHEHKGLLEALRKRREERERELEERAQRRRAREADQGD
jgi:hypothetical protein